MAAPRFLFVPGAWHGAWCFDLLLLELQRRHVRCGTLDLPGLGDDETPPEEVTFDAGVERVVGMIGSQRNVTLVGHSFGAFYATEAALRSGGRVREVICLSGYVPQPGDTFQALSELAPLQDAVQAHLTRDDHALHLSMQGAIDTLYADVPEGIAAAAASRLRPQPVAPFRDAAVAEREDAPPFRRRVLVAENDLVLDPEHCVQMAERTGVDVETIPTGHVPFLSMPKLLADTLLGVE